MTLPGTANPAQMRLELLSQAPQQAYIDLHKVDMLQIEINTGYFAALLTNQPSLVLGVFSFPLGRVCLKDGGVNGRWSSVEHQPPMFG